MTVDYGQVERTVIYQLLYEKEKKMETGFASLSEDRKISRLEQMRQTEQRAKLQMAEFIRDMFDALDNMNENEFRAVVDTLRGEGLTQSELIEKFRKYKGA